MVNQKPQTSTPGPENQLIHLMDLHVNVHVNDWMCLDLSFIYLHVSACMRLPPWKRSWVVPAFLLMHIEVTEFNERKHSQSKAAVCSNMTGHKRSRRHWGLWLQHHRKRSSAEPDRLLVNYTDMHVCMSMQMKDVYAYEMTPKNQGKSRNIFLSACVCVVLWLFLFKHMHILARPLTGHGQHRYDHYMSCSSCLLSIFHFFLVCFWQLMLNQKVRILNLSPNIKHLLWHQY